MMTVGMLGRKEKKEDPKRRTIQFRDVFNLSTMPSRPAGRDWTQREGVDLVYPMYGNDAYGDCAYASITHQGVTWTGQHGAELPVTAEQVVQRYLRDNGGLDEGAYMLDVAKSVVKEPLGGLVISAFVEVKPKDDDAFHACQEFLGGCWTGWALPKAWQGAEVWDTGPNTSGDWTPWSWGGHACSSPTYSPGGASLVTWTERVPYTHPARRIYCEEAYGLFSEPLWLALQKNCPAGLDLQKLMDLLALVRK